ncbi:large ribosomal subunit protein bL27-like [Macrobrachium nipponense]|uniref:large ribosomal subunit protein bL27-like n=1 Tax=Macrobrachium nipponense TaxID=159736 RepID=UPI0030C7EC5E
MAGLMNLQTLFTKLSLSCGPKSPGGLVTCVRNASKKSGGSSKNRVGRPRGKHRGIKKKDLTEVTRGTILVRQLGLDFHPGLNVGIGNDRSLFAKEPGTVIMTTEKLNPNWNHKEIKRFYAEYQDGSIPIYKNLFPYLAKASA